MNIDIAHTIVFTKLWKAIQSKKRVIVQEGSSRSSKTWSNFQALFLYCMLNPKTRVSVFRDTAVDCRDIVEGDFEMWVADPCVRQKQFERGEIDIDELEAYLEVEDLNRFMTRDRTKHIWKFKNGSRITFDGLDKISKAMGKTQDIIWLNEPYLFSEAVYKQLAQRTSKFILIDWNPMQDHFIERLKKLDTTEVIHSTFLDNPFCPEESRNQILSYQMVSQSEVVESEILTEDEAFRYDFELNENGLTEKQIIELKRTIYNQNNSTHVEDDKWHWQVFGKGEKGERPNRIFKWTEISLRDYYEIDVPIYYAVDWGENDPWGILEVKYYDGGLYVRELNYDSEQVTKQKLIGFSEDDLFNMGGLVVWKFNNLGIKKNRPVVCDNNYPKKVESLRDHGWVYAIEAMKPPGSRLENRSWLRKLKVYYTSCSKNVKKEQENHSWATDSRGNKLNEPQDGEDHCFSAGTKILTERGLVNIEEVVIGDVVINSFGKNKVIKTFNNGVKKTNKYSMLFDTLSVSLTCTDNHKIKTDQGWKQIKELKKEDKIYLHKSLMEKNTTCITEKGIFQNTTQGFMSLFGNFITALKCLKVFMFIILMKIHITTISAILKSLKVLNILGCMVKKELKKIKNGLRSFMLKVLKKQKIGMLQKKELNGIDSMLLKMDLETKHTEKGYVKNVEKLLLKRKKKLINYVLINVSQEVEEDQELTISKLIVLFVKLYLLKTNTVKLKLVEIKTVRTQLEQVYDLMIENNHEYVANGVVVHNCIDPLGYLTRLLISEGIIKIV